MPWKRETFGQRMAAQREASSVDYRPSAAVRGYGRTWRRLRLMFLRAYPVCADCGGPASEVHHVLPLAEGGTHDAANLRALCKPCHSRVTGREKQGVGGGCKLIQDAGL